MMKKSAAVITGAPGRVYIGIGIKRGDELTIRERRPVERCHERTPPFDSPELLIEWGNPASGVAVRPCADVC
jgi:hypothetical protein